MICTTTILKPSSLVAFLLLYRLKTLSTQAAQLLSSFQTCYKPTQTNCDSRYDMKPFSRHQQLPQKVFYKVKLTYVAVLTQICKQTLMWVHNVQKHCIGFADYWGILLENVLFWITQTMPLLETVQVSCSMAKHVFLVKKKMYKWCKLVSYTEIQQLVLDETCNSWTV